MLFDDGCFLNSSWSGDVLPGFALAGFAGLSRGIEAIAGLPLPRHDRAEFFLGDRTRLFVDVGQPDPLVVESHVRREFAHGDAVYLRVDPRGMLVL